MKKTHLLKVWIALIFFTILVALVATGLLNLSDVTSIILGISILKFLAVVFYFMELKKAHVFWKTAVIIYAILFSVIILMIR